MKFKVLSEPQGMYQLYCFLLMVGLFVCMELLGPLFVYIEKEALFMAGVRDICYICMMS